jgi:hypothetical protein
MSVLNKLENGGSQFSRLDGGTPEVKNFQQSTLHHEYSINDEPIANEVRPRNGSLPSPSQLNRTVGDTDKYLSNLPR